MKKNKALEVKLVWSMYSHNKVKWASTLQRKYLEDDNARSILLE